MKPKSIAATLLSAMALGVAMMPVYVCAENALSTPPIILAATQAHHGVGAVTQIDRKGRRIELKHGPIKSIGWMTMTMFFEVGDTDILDEVDVGDEVGFDFIETRDKRYVITDIETQG